MEETLDTRKASLGREWRPLTDEHERQLKRAEGSFSSFANGEEVDPLALVGAYRSGKTQLIYHLYNDAWDRGIPAFYIGDPGEMLTEFTNSEETDLNSWIQEQIDEQLTALAENNPSEIHWFPNADTETKREFVENHANDIDSDKPVKTALFFDEVEQSYREFIRAMDKDDDNPLRKINDGLQDSIKVWSFGMISAFEFIGEADWGRMREIRIPPLEVGDVRELLEDQRPDATELANVIWWLSRGRTGLIIKLIDGLPKDIETEAVDWLRELASANFRNTRPINNLWTDLDRNNWEQAINAILFLQDGLESWQVEQREALSATQCQHLAINILKDEFSFDQTEEHQDALEILDRNVKRVFSGLAVTEESLFPTFGLSDKEQADAFLSLVSDMTVSFEPASAARSTAIEALDESEGVFHTNWIERASKADAVDQYVVTAAPKTVQAAFPPIAVNPERVSDGPTDQFREDMEKGLSVQTGVPANESVTIRFCPTVHSFEAELTELTNSYDITDPTILVVPEDDGFDRPDDSKVDVYSRHQLLEIESYQSNRFWTFIVNLYGRLEEEGLSNPYTVDGNKKAELLSRCDEREVRNTIETLYDQLQQVAIDKIEKLENAYRDTYSLPNTNALLWEEERLNSGKPYWSNGEFVESTIALSYLPLFGPEYEPTRDYSKLYKQLKYAIDKDLVAGNKGGFQFKSYFDDLFTQSGYSESVATERTHYEENGQLAPAVKQTRDALTALAKLNDVSTIIGKLDDPDIDLRNGQVPVASVSGLTHLGYGLIRALLISGLTTGTDSEIDLKARLRTVISDIESEITTIEDYKHQVESRNDQLTSPNTADVGKWIDIKVSRLDQYETNLEQVRNGVKDLINKIEADSSASPIAYHYWFLLDIYVDDISEQIDDLESQIAAASVDGITDAVRLFESIHAMVADEDFIDLVFESRQSLLSRVEDYGDRVFNLESHLGYTELSIPEDNEDLQTLNDTVDGHITHLSSLESDLEKLQSESAELEEELDESREVLMDLLTEPDTPEVAND
jgi:predicted  nucleic acid-binding Zn-ribbon protein